MTGHDGAHEQDGHEQDGHDTKRINSMTTKGTA